MIETGLGTHFDERIPLTDLQAVRAFGFGWARIDAQEAAIEVMLAMRDDAAEAGLESLTIVYDLERLRALPPSSWAEWGNELDFTMRPGEYRKSLDAAANEAASRGIHLIAPCISNLDKDSLRWMSQVRKKRWPDGMEAVSIHRYGDGTFQTPHKGFRSREHEVEALRELCDDLPFWVTEFGYKTGEGKGFVTEDEQASRTIEEWQFWEDEGASVAMLYQLNDGQSAEEGFGIRRVDGTWKPVANTVPQETT